MAFVQEQKAHLNGTALPHDPDRPQPAEDPAGERACAADHQRKDDRGFHARVEQTGILERERLASVRPRIDAKLLRAAFSRPPRKSATVGWWLARARQRSGYPRPLLLRREYLPKVRIRAHPPPAAPSFAASKTGSFGAGSTLQTPNATERSMIAEVLGLIWRAAGTYSKDGDNCPMQLRRRVQTH
jgi:hypothetical protein